MKHNVEKNKGCMYVLKGLLIRIDIKKAYESINREALWEVDA